MNIILTNCDLCGSTRYVNRVIENSLPIVECLDCGLVFVREYPQMQDTAEVIDFYVNGTNEEQANPILERYEGIYNHYTEIFASFLPPKAKVLDVGSGYGLFLSKMQKKGFDTFGLDVSHACLEFAKRTYGLNNLFRQDLLASEFPDNTFDLITLWNVFEHVCNPSEVIKKCAKLLKPNGALVIKVPNMKFQKLVFRLIFLVDGIRKLNNTYDTGGKIPYLATQPPAHLFGFTPSTMKKYFEKAGLTPTSLEPAKLSNSVNESVLYKIMDRSVNILFRVSGKTVNYSPTLLAYATKASKLGAISA